MHDVQPGSDLIMANAVEDRLSQAVQALTGSTTHGVQRTIPRYKIDRAVSKQVKILTLDIETTPNTLQGFGMFNQNFSLQQLVEPGRMFCWVAKWYDSRSTIFSSDHHDGHEKSVKDLWELINEADIVVGFNSISFDMKHIHREFLLAGLPPTSPYRNIDLMRAAKKRFRFASNKLDHMAGELGLGNKTTHSGFPLWKACMQGDEKAWALMKRYNVQDVRLTEALYDILRPWIENHPHLGQFSGAEWCCPNCGHKDVSNHRKGTAKAFVQTYRQYQCPKCTTWIRGNKRLADPKQTRSSRTF